MADGLAPDAPVAPGRLGDLDGALTAIGTASHLNARCGEGLMLTGAIAWHEGDAQTARELFALVAGNITDCTPFRTAELESAALCGLGQSSQAAEHLREALSERTPGDLTEPRAMYDLLSDPPLEGIDLLRSVAES
jgi:lipopolysaccharide biosynthesis regulator YciM